MARTELDLKGFTDAGWTAQRHTAFTITMKRDAVQTVAAVPMNTGMTPAWIVCSWPAVLWQADNPRDWRFVHLGTHVVNTASARQLGSGQTVWGSATDQPVAGVAWDWVELPQGVLALADPMGLVSNLRFIDANGVVLPTLRAAMQLNDIVHALPWQNEVHRLLHQQAA